MPGSHNFGPPIFGLAGFTSAGINQATAQPISIQESVFTAVPTGTGCRLPSPASFAITIYNQGANTLLVYPAVGDQIGGNAINAPVSIVAGSSAVFSSFDGPLTQAPRTWYQQSSGSGGGSTGPTGPTGATGPSGPSGGGGAVLSTGDISVSSAEILTAFSNPKVLIAAPGVGKIIKVLQVTYKYTFNTTAYTSIDPISTFAGPFADNLPWDLGVSLAFPFSAFYWQPCRTSLLFSPAHELENQPLFLGCPINDPTDGDGTLMVNVLYWI